MKDKRHQRQIERKYEMLMLGADAHTRLNVKQKTWLLKVLVLALILRLQVLGDRGQRAVFTRPQLFLALPGILTLTILTSAVLRLNRDMVLQNTGAGSCNESSMRKSAVLTRRMWKHEMAVVSASHQVMLLAVGAKLELLPLEPMVVVLEVVEVALLTVVLLW